MGVAKSIAVHLIIHAVNTETCIVAYNRYRIAGFYCEKNICESRFLSEEIFAMFDNCVHNRRYIEDI